ncbi:MAG: hypothetical protein NZ571_05340 [Anaerolineae bacterium]|nr:hypothetical protein [Anaerolineae bacterium]
MRNNWNSVLILFFVLMMLGAFLSGSPSIIVFMAIISIVLGALIVISSSVWHTFNAVFGSGSTTQIAQRSIGRQAERNLAYSDDESPRARAVPREVAWRAMQRAKNRPEDWLLSLEDIGVLAYHGDDTPDVVRLNPVAPDTTHLRPFAVIHIPYKQGRGTISFELLDELGTRRFVSSEQYLLKEGNNFITPRTYMPLPNERTSGMWTLRMSIGDKLIAEHEFPVRTRINTPVRNMLADDGEVDQWLASAILEQGRQGSGMSLDELLADQSDEGRSSRLR